MSASLVGSEMCIRDSTRTRHAHTNAHTQARTNHRAGTTVQPHRTRAPASGAEGYRAPDYEDRQYL
eukprot:13444700-Alexandrium_andersonii.AAC.1